MRYAPAVALLAALATPAFADDEGSAGEPVEDLSASDSTRADKGAFGVGIILGEPTGVYLADDHAIQGALGFAFVGGGLHVHADYVIHPLILQAREQFVLPAYVGAGVRVIDYRNGRDDDSIALGLRIVGGFLFDFKQIPLDAFVEVAGVLEYEFQEDAGAGLALNLGAGARYYF
jgi:hypothetical protein